MASLRRWMSEERGGAGMYAVVLTGRVLPGCSADAVWSVVAAKFNLDVDGFGVRVLHRAPVTIRELADLDQAQRMQSILIHCGAEADLVPTDGVRWQLKSGDGQKGPVPLEFLRVAYARKMLAGNVLVRRSADTQWLPLESISSSPANLTDRGDAAAATRNAPLPPPLPPSPPPGPSEASARTSTIREDIIPPLPSSGIRGAESFKGTHSETKAPRWPWAIVGFAILIGCGWGLVTMLEHAARTGCGDAEAVNLATSLIYEDLGKRIVLTMYGPVGEIGMAASQENVAAKAAKSFVSLDLTAISTTKRNGAVFECSALLAAKDPPTEVNPGLSMWQKAMVTGLNGHVVTYTVTNSDDLEHIVVSVHPIQ